ncbi:PhoX family protein [Halomonas sp. M20]|uniref:PhoX family protein n=1 Tax=Halomonas sp. M20 TaxID=2763264 RepID=UPI001D09CE20|nr:PhoX family phosphatase [Halomonas sp. M20]
MSEFDNEPSYNSSDNEPFSSILERNWSRRHVMRGGLALAASTLFGNLGLVQADSPVNDPTRPSPSAAARNIKLRFEPVPGSKTDAVVVPKGYTATILAPWGTPLNRQASAWKSDGSNSAQDQANAVGMHHDGMHFFAIDGRSDDGLLLVNNEYIDQDALHPNGATRNEMGKRPADEVRKEINAHGISAVRIVKENGQWHVLSDDPLNRRYTSATVMDLAGPMAGTDHVKTAFSKDGTQARGTNNNCGNGYTPWGTYLTCEENWPDIFINRAETLPADQQRLGMPTEESRYGWETAAQDASERESEFARFDLTPRGDDATQDYRNEASTFGYIVEIDPFDVKRRAVKRTALGRFRHEGCWPGKLEPGKPVVFYSGHDARFEYIYKFVSKANWDPADANPKDRLATGAKYMDKGTLYVACFNDDGSGQWLPLTPEAPTQQNYSTLGKELGELPEIILNTARAADLVGATPMDRPEWGNVDPASGDVYMTLTNNDKREIDQLSAPNPRPRNENGQIIRWRETGDNSFRWTIFVFGASAKAPDTINRSALTQDNQFASPDGLMFDPRGILWIQTDNSDNAVADYTNDQMLAVIPSQVTSREGYATTIDERSQELLKRFLVGPNDCEITGFAMTPDHTSLFINVQHPGNWPYDTDATQAAPGGSNVRPRSSTIVIQREDNGEIGV